MSTPIGELQANEQHFKHALSLVKLGYWYWVPQTGKLVWSDESFNLLGLDARTCGEPTMELYVSRIHPEDVGFVQGNMQRVMETGSAPAMEYRVLRDDGSVITVTARAEMVKNEDGSPQYLFGTLQDVSDQKAQESKLQEAINVAEKASMAKSDFLASMSHELRTPMNSIIGFAQLLDMEALTETQSDFLSEILRGGKHLLVLINEVLDLSSIESGKLSLSIETVHIEPVIKECVHLLQPLAEKKSIQINVDAKLSPEHFVQADRVRFKQLLLNLMSNAVKYNKPNGEVNVLLDGGGDSIGITVADTGVGISEEHQAMLFTPFERFDFEGGTIEGSGIGLVIAKRIAEAMSGQISFKSEKGRGSQFTVMLRGGLENTQSAEQMSALDKLSPVSNASDGNMRILYVEDNPANLKLVESIMSLHYNAKLELASTPKLGLDLAMHHDFDLIILDINMPEMNGFELLGKLKQSEKTKQTPVIALTANALQKNVEKGLSAGFDRYFTKPVDVKKLLDYISDVEATLVDKVNQRKKAG